MLNQIKHFGTSGEIATLIKEVNNWLRENDGKVEVVGISESQGGSLGDDRSRARSTHPEKDDASLAGVFRSLSVKLD